MIKFDKSQVGRLREMSVDKFSLCTCDLTISMIPELTSIFSATDIFKETKEIVKTGVQLKISRKKLLLSAVLLSFIYNNNLLSLDYVKKAISNGVHVPDLATELIFNQGIFTNAAEIVAARQEISALSAIFSFKDA